LTTNEGPPTGRQYRELYTRRDDPALDSQFFRIRLLTLLQGDDIPIRSQLSKLFTKTMGITGINFHDVVQKAPIDRLLSFITVLYGALIQHAASFHSNQYQQTMDRLAPAKLVSSMAQLFQEEGMAYEIDNAGGVHPLVDAEFQHNRRDTLASLTSPRYANVDHAFQAAFKRLTVQSFDTKAAVRDIFDAAESLFKLMLALRNPDLTGGAVKSDLRPVVDRAVADSDTATKQASGRILSSFGKWADACHPYRHGQQSETIIAPPADLATLLLSQGASFIRWLAGLDRWLQANPKGADRVERP
jgi:hypothetical protein